MVTAPAPSRGDTSEAFPDEYHLGYQPGLDGIRGYAVVLIMVFHSFVIWFALFRHGVPGAYITVNLFFVLSGFLITSLLLEEWARHGRISFGSFYLRRVLRLVPALIFVLVCELVFLLVTRRALRSQLEMMGWIIGYSSNWAQWAHAVTNQGALLTWGHTWTLAVEEQFYVVWPAVMTVLLVLRLRARTVLAIFAAGIVASTVARQWVVDRMVLPAGAGATEWASALERHVAVRTDLRADTLLLGAGAAVLLHAGWKPGRAVRHAGTVALAVLLAVSFFVEPDARWMYGWGFTLVDLCGAVMCVVVLDRAWFATRVFRAKIGVWLGRLSYALYLWHPPVFLAVVLEAPSSWGIAPKLAVAWVLSFAGASLSYYAIELPFLRLKARFSRRAHGSVGPPATAALVGSPVVS